MIRRSLSTIAIAASLCLAGPALSAAEINMLFILDGSNSMWGEVDGVPKIVTAKDVLGRLLTDLPPDTKVGLMAYGHRTAECTDVEVISSIGKDSPEALVTKLNAIVPRGKTPIGYAIRQSSEVFKALPDENNHVILISDGIETCGGDPCKAAGLLKKIGINVRVHVVGFDVNKDERGQLECIADAGGGRYFHASSTEGLKGAIAEVKKEVQVVKPKPKPKPKPKAKEYFFDDFDGDELKEHWEVINPDPDAFIVEDGVLLVLNSSPATLSSGDIPNLFRLTKSMPKGDWIITAKLTINFQTAQEAFILGLYDDKSRWTTIQVTSSRNDYTGHSIDVHWSKKSGNKVTTQSRPVASLGCNICKAHNSWDAFLKKHVPQPLYLRLKKERRNYFVSAKLEGGKGSKWLELPKFTLLRAKGNLTIGLTQRKKVKGETTATIDWVKIETLE